MAPNMGRNAEIYLDNAATTKPFDEVVRHMSDVHTNYYGNPSSLHIKGLNSEKLIKEARATVAECIGASPDEVVFTSGGTESNNLAICGYLSANPRSGKHILVSSIEHPSVLEITRNISSGTSGFIADYVSVDKNGYINIDDFKKKIKEDTALVSIMMVNNETGAIQPIEAVARILKERGSKAALHVDAVQAFGKIPVLPAKMGIDLMTVSSHKIHGPKGTGALFIKKGVKVRPIILGGGQEGLIRSGTENVAGISGFGLAAKKVCGNLLSSSERLSSLKERFKQYIINEIGGVKINTPPNASPYLLNITFEKIKGESLLHHLEQKGVYVSTGSACSSRKKMKSYVLAAMGLDKNEISGAIRFSFSSLTSEEEIWNTLHILKGLVYNLRRQYVKGS